MQSGFSIEPFVLIMQSIGNVRTSLRITAHLPVMHSFVLHLGGFFFSISFF